MPPAALALTTTQVLRIIEELDGIRLPPATLGYWSATEAAPASIRHTGNAGEMRLYSLRDVERVRLLVRLRAAGVRMPRLRAVIAAVERDLPELLSRRPTSAVLRVTGWGAVIERPGRAAQHVPSGQLMLPLSEVQVNAREVQRIIAA